MIMLKVDLFHFYKDTLLPMLQLLIQSLPTKHYLMNFFISLLFLKKRIKFKLLDFTIKKTQIVHFDLSFLVTLFYSAKFFAACAPAWRPLVNTHP